MKIADVLNLSWSALSGIGQGGSSPDLFDWLKSIVGNKGRARSKVVDCIFEVCHQSRHWVELSSIHWHLLALSETQCGI